MKMKCPYCRVSGSVSDSLLGRKVRCPKCKEVFKAIETTAPPAPEKDHSNETSGYMTDTRPSPDMTSQDEAALEDEIAKIFEDMKSSPTDPEPDFWKDMQTSEKGETADGSEENIGSLSEEDLKSELEDILGEKCSACGALVGKNTQHNLEGKVYCSACLPAEGGEENEASSSRDLAVSDSDVQKASKTDWEGKAAILAALGIIAVILYAAFYIIVK
jgi:predicted Zn finger-like uncharacterized protein